MFVVSRRTLLSNDLRKIIMTDNGVMNHDENDKT